MQGVLLGVAVFISVLIAVTLYRVAVGPTLYDRLLAANVIGTKSTLILVVIGFLFERPALFVDLALVYALLGFVGVVALGKYLEQRLEVE